MGLNLRQLNHIAKTEFSPYMRGMEFLIMNGAGNRFGIFDARDHSDFTLTPAQVKTLSKPDGKFMGEKGADQIIIMRQPKTSQLKSSQVNASGLNLPEANSPQADIFMEIWNREGFEVDACGNATRCVAWLHMQESQRNSAIVQTNADILHAKSAGELSVTVDMGEPRLDWNQIPLKEYMSTHIIDVKLGPIDNPILHSPGAVSMGNPHCVFFVENAETIAADKIGPMVEFHPIFPEQANVGFCQVKDKDRIRLRVWERGCGLTQACGTGACAAVVAGVRQRKLNRKVEVEVDGGVLQIDWQESDNRVLMTGPVEVEGTGEFSL